MANPWWTYPRIDNFGTTDPQGNYWKPDSNIQLPGSYPVTALLPGTVTGVQQTSWGQVVVTIKLDVPLNMLATHTFYEHMGSASVGVGQHVNQGDLIGYNNPQGLAPLGFGLYPGDAFGSGPGWNQLQSDLAPGGSGWLNPVNLLNAAQGGNTSLSNLYSTSTTEQPNPSSQQTGNPITDAIAAAFAPIGNFFTTLGGAFQPLAGGGPPRILVGALGAVLAIVGLVMAVIVMAPSGVKKAVKVAAIA